MFLLILAIWVVLIFSLRVALFGNPLHRLVSRQPPQLLEHLDRRMEGKALPPDLSEPEADFVRRFSRLAVLELVLLILEIAILVFFLLSWDFTYMAYYWLCLAILLKNILSFFLSWFYSQSRRRRETGLFRQLMQAPVWLRRLDRLSAALSAAAFILLLLKISGFWPGNDVV